VAKALGAVASEADAIATPVLPMLTPALDAPAEVFDRERHFMGPFSLAGLPAISVPCGSSRSGLPIGMQLVADRLRDARLFRIALACEADSAWHARLPQRP
jgi:Asp-tRNA(Asn)/Glu-tRNA(Gln) amidotransferase A subunit family amidase